MARLPKKEREHRDAQILSDWKAGYSQNHLSKKYDVSVSIVNKLCKGVPQDNVDIVNSQVAINTKLAAKSEYEVNSITKAVEEKTRHLEIIHKMTEKNLKHLAGKINDDASIGEHKIVQDAIHRAGQTLGVIDQFAPRGDINVSANAAAAAKATVERTLDDFYSNE